MKRIVQLSLLLLIPFLLQADHRRNSLNGRWINPYLDHQIRLKVRQNHIRVRGLSQRGWVNFLPIRRNVFEDRNGNQIRIRSTHNLVFINRLRGKRIQFVKKGHRRQHHICSAACSVDGFFDYSNRYYDVYGLDNHHTGDWSYPYSDLGYPDGSTKHRLDGQYHVREIDEYVQIDKTHLGLRARRKNQPWVEYTQNKLRKNEYIDRRGNRYIVRADGEMTWRSKDGEVILNLKK